MTARSFATNERNTSSAVRAARPKMFTNGLSRYHVEVIASDVVDVVRSAGGWLFDRATAGWDVNVLVAGRCDVRPLQILGANTRDLESQFDSIDNGARAPALAVGVDMFARDARIREDVLDALGCGVIEVTLWGDTWPAELDRSVDPARHVLSTASRAFKAHALAAAGFAEESVGPIETFRIGATTCAPLDPELMPVS